MAFVPTMGALHEGHLSLVRLARGVADVVIMSIFVNPLQFGPSEDYARYPRTLDVDLAKAEAAGVDIVFTPSVAEIYPAGRQISINAGAIGAVLEGAARPGHFDGVLTVVLKLLNIVRPDIAVFGRKDAQQLACIRRMVLDLNLDTDIVGAPIVREPDGLAMSSRNRFLSPAERTSALSLHASLCAAELETTPTDALAAAERVLAGPIGTGEIVLDYVLVVNAATMVAVPTDHRGPALAVVAATVGTTRLIDNVELTFPESDSVTAPGRGLTAWTWSRRSMSCTPARPTTSSSAARRWWRRPARPRTGRWPPPSAPCDDPRGPPGWSTSTPARHPTSWARCSIWARPCRPPSEQLSGPDLRRLSVDRGKALAAATRRAVALGHDHGYDAPEAARLEVTQTLQAALADPDVAEQVRTGTVTQAQAYGGFGAFALAPPTTATAAEPQSRQAESPQAETPEAEASAAGTADDEADERRAEAESRLQAAEAALSEAADDADAATARADELADRVEALRAELADAERAESEAQRSARAARKRVSELEADVRSAREAYEAL